MSPLVDLTACAIGLHRDIPPLADDEAERLFTDACHHNVAPLVAKAIVDSNTSLVPPSVRLKFLYTLEQANIRFEQREKTTAQLLHLFNSHGIETMLLKGISLAAYYPQPRLRIFSDIDIYQFGRWREADRLAAIEFGAKLDNRIHHHTHYGVNNILIENHFDIINRHAAIGNSHYEQILKQTAADNPRRGTLLNEACLLPPPQFNALFLLKHMALHFAADDITLRHLVDWTLFCRVERNNIDTTALHHTMQHFGMMPFVAAMEYACAELLGHTPLIANKQDNEATQRLIEEVLHGKEAWQEPSSRQVVARLQFKWKRVIHSRWKHSMVTNVPWLLDFMWAIRAKIMKPHTILH